MQKSNEISNSKILSVFLFQYSLFIPLMNYVKSSYVIAASSLILLFLLLSRNGFVLDRDVFVSITLIVLFLCFKILCGSDFEVLIDFLLYAMPCGFIFSCIFDRESFIIYCCNLSYLNFALVLPYPFFIGYNYMRFGYGMLPSLIFIFSKLSGTVNYKLFNRWWNRSRIIDFLIFVAGAAEILFLGNRGALLALIIYILLDRFAIHKEFNIRNLFYITVGILGLIFINPILEILKQLASVFGFLGRTINQMIRFLNDGFGAASAGRVVIYAEYIEKIKNHIFLGNNIIMDVKEFDYAHNIFLQVLHDCGIVGFIPLVIVLISALVKIMSTRYDIYTRLILSVLFSLSIGRLLFSSTLWLRPEFWMFVFFLLANSHHLEQKVCSQRIQMDIIHNDGSH